MRFRLVQELAADGVRVAVACRMLVVSTSGYYEWCGRPPSLRAVADEALSAQIREIHTCSRGTYGAPRVHAELRLGRGVRCGRKRIARLMRLAGLHGIYVRRRRRSCPAPPVHDDLVRRRFVADAPDRLWLTDITEHPTREGKVYLAAVLDVYARRIVGWSIADHLRSPPQADGRAGDGSLATPSGSRPDGVALGPWRTVHLVGLRPPAARGGPARVDGPRRLGLR
jgi:putative transposase